MNENGKELQVRGFMNPASVKEGMELAQWIAKSDLAPKDYKDKPQNVLIAMQMGAEVGLSPMQAIQNIAVINGRPSVWGDSMLALCQAHPDFESINENESTAEKGVCIVKRKGMEAQRREFSIDDAKKAGLWAKQGPWQTAPARMLKLRARAFALRDTFADALRGLSSAEEQRDIIETTLVEKETTTTESTVAMPKRASETMKESAPTTDVVVGNEERASVFIADVKKFSGGIFEIIDSEGVTYRTESEAVALSAKEAKGSTREIRFQVFKDRRPVLLEVFPVAEKAVA